MIQTLQQILQRTFDRLAAIATAWVPPLLAGIILFAMSLILAVLVRWTLLRLGRAPGFERFLEQSGLASIVTRRGRLCAAQLISRSAYWLILLAGVLTAISAFDTQLSARMVESTVFLLPKLVTAAAMLLTSAWLAQYLGRSVLVWACNEGLPYPRWLAGGARLLVAFVGIVVAADHLDFARVVFLSAFWIVIGGLVLAASIAAGTGLRAALRRRLDEAAIGSRESESSIWHHV